MELVQVRPQDLKHAEYNPRKMTEQQAMDLKKSIEEFGFVDPVIVNSNADRHNVIIGGHQRVRIAEILGLATIPVFYKDLTLEREQELNLRLNKNVGEWDFSMLANFDEVMLESVGFAKEDFNFDLGGAEAETKQSKEKQPTQQRCPECDFTWIKTD